MASRASLNKVMLIGNLTRDPELRYTPSGAAVCTFAVATNRTYTASDGTKKEEAEFTKIVAWGKLGELCNQLLAKGRKVYVDGRLQTRSWETPDGQNRQTTEVVIDDMRILDSRREAGLDDNYQVPEETLSMPEEKSEPVNVEGGKRSKAEKVVKEEEQPAAKPAVTDDIDLEDLPF